MRVTFGFKALIVREVKAHYRKYIQSDTTVITSKTLAATLILCCCGLSGGGWWAFGSWLINRVSTFSWTVAKVRPANFARCGGGPAILTATITAAQTTNMKMA